MATEVGWDGCPSCFGCSLCNADCCNDCTSKTTTEMEKCSSCGQTLSSGTISVHYSDLACNCEGHTCKSDPT